MAIALRALETDEALNISLDEVEDVDFETLERLAITPECVDDASLVDEIFLSRLNTDRPVALKIRAIDNRDSKTA